jgi:hypothetical protein
MSSTRNKNTHGDYQLEQNAYMNRYLNITDLAKQTPDQKILPGNGLLQGKVVSRDLANNYTDIESTLFGIGSTNLVQALPEVVPEIHRLPSLNIINKIPMIVPNPIYVDKTQRANYLN